MKKYFDWLFENQCKSQDWEDFNQPIANVLDDMSWFFDHVRDGHRAGSIPSNFENTFYRQDWMDKTAAGSNSGFTSQELHDWIHDPRYKHLMDHAGIDKINQFSDDVAERVRSIMAQRLDLVQEDIEFYCHNEGPGMIFPLHFDRHRWGRFTVTESNQAYDPNYNLYLIFFDDWKPGQCFQMGDQFIRWKAGDVYSWNHVNTPHGSCNFGFEDRYTLLVNGKSLKI